MITLILGLSNLTNIRYPKFKRPKSAKYLEQQFLFSLENNICKYLIDEEWYSIFNCIDFENAWDKKSGDITLKLYVCEENAHLYNLNTEDKIWHLSPFDEKYELLSLSSKDILWGILNYDTLLKLIYTRLNFLMDHSEELLAIPRDNKQHWFGHEEYIPKKRKVVNDCTYDCSCNLLPRNTGVPTFEILPFWGGKYLKHCIEEHDEPYVILWNEKSIETDEFLLVDISIEDKPKILSATRTVLPMELKDIYKAMDYISRNKDIFLKYFNNKHTSKVNNIFGDEELRNALINKGEYHQINSTN